MTRDQAIKLAGDTGAIRPGDFIDMCVGLGMLKLDEPPRKTLYGKISDAQAKFTDHTPPADVRLAFNAVGLDIVEIVEKVGTAPT